MREWTVGRHGYSILVDGRMVVEYGDGCDDFRDGPPWVTDFIEFIVDACNEKERRLAAGHVAGCWGCGQSPCIHSYVSSNLSGDFDD